MKTALKIIAAVLVALVVGGAIAGLLLPDAMLRTVTGPLGDKAVHAKHATNEALGRAVDDSIYSVKSLWWSVSGKSGDDNSASKMVVDLPLSLREQLGKSRSAPAEAEEPADKPAETQPAMASHQPTPEAGHETKPEPKAKPEAAPMAPPPPPPPPEPKREPKPAPTPAAEQPAPTPAPKPAPVSKPMPAKQVAATPADDGTADHKRGLAYYKGDGVAKDFRKASEWFEKAAAKGHAGAQYNLGIMAYLGQGTDKDFATAAKWFREAAEQGHAAAQYNLGFLFYEGKGVPKDDLQAYTWIDRAANQGHTKAQTARDALAKALPKDIFKSK